jgi:hypothetical protein
MKEYTQKLPVGKTELTKEDLRRLLLLIADHPSPDREPAGHRIDTTPSGSNLIISTSLGDLVVSASNPDEFFHHFDLPPCLENLSLQYTGDTGTTGGASATGGTAATSASAANGRRLTLQLGVETSTLQISSTDETWTLGKSKQLMRFLHAKRPFPRLPWSKNTRIVLAVRPFWEHRVPTLNLLLALLGLLVSIALGILQLIKK